MARDRRERGQGLVEFALVLPILIVLITSVGELGLIFGKIQSLGYASREGARVGAALAQGTGCLASDPNYPDTAKVDATLIGAAQRILTSPDSGIRLADVQEIRIFRADANGRPESGTLSSWAYTGANSGPEIDPRPRDHQDRLHATERGLAGVHASQRREGRRRPAPGRVDRRDRLLHVPLRHPTAGGPRRPVGRSALPDAQ